MRIVLALCALLMAAPASADDMPISHQVALGMYVASAAADYHSTYRVLSYQGSREHNPLGRLTRDHPGATVGLGIALDAAVTTLLYKWLGDDHPKLTTALLFTATSIRLSLAVHNYNQLRPGLVKKP